MLDFTYEHHDEKNNQIWEVNCTFNYYQGEAEVRYYSDGSGYPGCPAEVEILDYTVIRHEIFIGDPESDGKWVKQPLGKDVDTNFWEMVEKDQKLQKMFEELAFEAVSDNCEY